MINVDNLTFNQHFSCLVSTVVGPFWTIDDHPFFPSSSEMIVFGFTNHIILHLWNVGQRSEGILMFIKYV